ncbi:TVP38/TMEM64 family protein [Bacillus spongiae]|uniref:TVP38/TMEM64 family membrane protein n=1 Tax=Bacillus spongiae TaxID=2683610 RepID=A0ABU8HJW4_9BACI
MKKGALMKVAAFILVLLLLLWFSGSYINVSPQQIRDWILSFGWIAPVIFIVMYSVRPIILFPASVLSLAGGLAFGTFWGFVFIFIGALGAASVAYFIAATFQNSFIKFEQSERTQMIRKKMEENGFFIVLLLRFLPFLNFDLISYLGGLASVKYRSFLLATGLGIIPGTLAYSFLGSSLVSGNKTIIFIAVALFLIVLLVPIIAKGRVKELLGLSSKK